jgi:hypothetical protein
MRVRPDTVADTAVSITNTQRTDNGVILFADGFNLGDTYVVA